MCNREEVSRSQTRLPFRPKKTPNKKIIIHTKKEDDLEEADRWNLTALQSPWPSSRVI